MQNSWPNGDRRAIHQDEHEAWNSTHYPGTRQLCSECAEPTGRCTEDALYAEDTGPLCEACYAQLTQAENEQDNDNEKGNEQ